jgi:hypothetical protein
MLIVKKSRHWCISRDGRIIKRQETMKVRVYIEDGSLHPSSAVIETQRDQHVLVIHNTGQLEFPLAACVEADNSDGLVWLLPKTYAISFSQAGAVL